VGWFNPSFFIHAANITLCWWVSALATFLWLQLLAVASSLMVLPFFVQQPVLLWEPIIWSSIFAAISLSVPGASIEGASQFN